ncbi:MAG: penicillin-insensitive murein endopeptidase [Syntrophobacteraceae bacterium]
MTRRRPLVKLNAVNLFIIALFTFFTLSPVFVENSLYALTISSGEPFRGKLINGVQFPSQMAGCKVIRQERSYTTPEVVGAMLDALEMFREKYPDSCEIALGDFSREGGGRLKGHESHQNGRDVDIGLFAMGNIPSDLFGHMNPRILDVPKTWHMVQSLLNTLRIENIYLDRSIQTRLYKHALSEGVPMDYLARIFQRAGSRGETEGVIQHEPGHTGHMHVRFFTPWSTLAGQLKEIDPLKQLRLEAAQQSDLPMRGSHFARGNEKAANQLARNFSEKIRDL